MEVRRSGVERGGGKIDKQEKYERENTAGRGSYHSPSSMYPSGEHLI